MLSPRRTVPAGITRPDYALTGQPADRGSRAIRTPDEIEAMRIAGAVAAEVLIEVGKAVAPGVTTMDVTFATGMPGGKRSPFAPVVETMSPGDTDFESATAVTRSGRASPDP